MLTIFRGICSAVAAFHQADPPLALRDIKVECLFYFTVLFSANIVNTIARECIIIRKK